MSPNLVDPEENDSVKWVTEEDIIYCIAVKSPVTVNEPLTVTELPVNSNALLPVTVLFESNTGIKPADPVTLLSRYVKLPSASAYVRADPFTKRLTKGMEMFYYKYRKLLNKKP